MGLREGDPCKTVRIEGYLRAVVKAYCSEIFLKTYEGDPNAITK